MVGNYRVAAQVVVSRVILGSTEFVHSEVAGISYEGGWTDELSM
jgi:hypothetical protein